ncbi:MAG: Hsp20/alpha crystallin family protein [Candidatus Faecousia sp.]|nr:Hsp20/alpha crystallin family protein [Bacillota bacterium]MDY4218966.1 Hsp20/alpha crystallin family protein [Candidatus Faecousia sp.]
MFNLTPYRKHNEVSYYDPFQMMRDMERQFFGEDSFGAFRTDIRDEGNAYTLEAELPGFDKEDIDIQLSDNNLTISASHKEESSRKEGKYVRRERSFGSYSRSFDVSDIDTAGIKAAYKNGLLSLNLPKKTETVPSTRTLAIE